MSFENGKIKTNKPPVDKFINNDWIFIPGGTFQMGSNDGEDVEKPVHSVTVSSFWMTKYLITIEEYSRFLNEKGNQTEGGVEWINLNEDSKIYKDGNIFKAQKDREKHPVNCVSWYGAREYCKWIGGELPTEAQWEYAAGNGEKHTKWSLGNDFVDENYVTNRITRKNTKVVGSKKANDFGLYDMSGNLWEWCLDWYQEDFYSISNNKDPVCQDGTSGSRVLRGGGWYNSESHLLCTYRYDADPSDRYSGYGFRVVFP